MTLFNWAKKWGLSNAAMLELNQILGAKLDPTELKSDDASEASAQQQVRLAASKRGDRLFRNNNGAFRDPTGREVRYGLANESKKMNKSMKSSDLIGITRVLITPEHVGNYIGVFTSVEMKEPGWVFRGTDREIAQLKWIQLIGSMGGIATFATRPEDLYGSE